MSFQVTTSFTQEFASGLRMVAQQKKSRLRGSVSEGAITGDRQYIDYLGTADMEDIVTRHGDTPLMETPHSRRRITSVPAAWGDLIDKEDQVRTLNDLRNPYVQVGAAAIGRKWDDRIIDAFFATAYTGVDGTTTVAFPAGNQVAVNSWAYGNGTGNSGLTVSKLIEALGILMEAEPDEDDPIYICCSQKQINNLLATTEASSADYNTVKTLVNGDIDTFVRAKFIRIASKRLPLDASGYRRIPMWCKSGMGLGISREAFGRITERADKNYSTQVYASIDCGATRLEETKVAEIKCAE